MVISDNTARRILIYFLVDIGAIKPLTAATYLVDAGLKTHSVSDLLEQIVDLKENHKKLDVLL